MPRGPQYTDEELLNAFQKLAERLERRPPLKRDMNKYGKHSARTYQDRFGSWSDAVEAAGFEPRDAGDNYHERPDACPLCNIEKTGLDFHHWRYGENEKGCYLCRGCHDDVHQGAAKTSNSGWLVPCVKNVVRLHMRYHESDPKVDQILERYNLPEVDDLVAAAIEDAGSN